ncbi:hypothetical protein N658DRAFT_435245, partial [Parathielavia hyrcaniae]
VSLTANIVFLIGGITPTTKDICLYRVNVTLLADGLERLARLDSGHAANLPSAELPTYWYWGMTGVIDASTGDTRCRRAFPPTQNLLGVLEESLRDHLGSDQEQLTNDIVTSWRTALDKIDPSRLVAKEAKYAAQLKASVALAILAFILDGATPFLALCLLHRSNRRPSYVPSFVSSVIAIAAGAPALLAMRDGVHPLLDTSEHAGPAIMVLFVGAGLRLLSCSGVWCASSPDRNHHRPSAGVAPYHGHDEYAPDPRIPLEPTSHPGMTDNQEKGFRGEKFLISWSQVYNWLDNQLPNWSSANWTSDLRKHAGFPDFSEDQRYIADFTYIDRSLAMAQVLRRAGLPVSPRWSAQTTFHLEVKATPRGRNFDFKASQYQVDLMHQYAGADDHAYILVRVFNLDHGPVTELFLDPATHPAIEWGPKVNGTYTGRIISR